MVSHARPLALGLLHLLEGASSAELTRGRVALALRANGEGYALVETYDFGVSGLRDDLQFRAVEEVAGRLDIQALMVSGEVDMGRVEELGQRLRLLVVVLAAAGA